MTGAWSSFGRRERFAWVGAVGAGLGMIAASFMLPGGEDLYRYYLPFEQGCLECGFVPYFAQWALAPLRLLPAYPLAWPFWTIVVVVGFLAIAYITRANPILYMLSFPFIGQIWLGQVDLTVCAGLLLFLLAKNPYARGAGIILALTKPQLAGLSILFGLLLIKRPQSLWKILIPPLAVLALSLVVFGPNWPVTWIQNSLRGLPEHVWRLAGADTWRYGLVLLPLPLLVNDLRERVQAGLLVSALATPFFGVYSYVTFLMFESRGWPIILSYAWLAGFYWFQEDAMRFAWVLPAAMLIDLIVRMRRSAGTNRPPQAVKPTGAEAG